MFTTIPDNQTTGQEAWRTEARCASGDGTLAATFFSEELQDIAAAKRICAECPVMADCLEGALERYEPYGVWGGQLFLNGKVLTNKRRRGRPPTARNRLAHVVAVDPARAVVLLRVHVQRQSSVV